VSAEGRVLRGVLERGALEGVIAPAPGEVTPGVSHVLTERVPAAHRLLAETFLRTHPVEAARVVDGLAAESVVPLVADVAPEVAATVVAHMRPAAAAACLEAMSTQAAAEIVTTLAPGTAAALARRMRPTAVAAVLAELPLAVGTALAGLLRHPPDTAGALLDPRVPTLPDDASIEAARTALGGAVPGLSFYVWVVRRDQTLVGVATPTDLLRADEAGTLADAMQPAGPRLPVTADRRMILAHPGWREWHALPVVEQGDGAFLGAITYETMRRLEAERHGRPERGPLVDALALAEAYLVGMTELVKGLASAARWRGASNGE